MRPLLAHESMWGNTEAVAPAVAKGVDHDVAVVHVADAPCRCPTMPPRSGKETALSAGS